MSKSFAFLNSPKKLMIRFLMLLALPALLLGITITPANAFGGQSLRTLQTGVGCLDSGGGGYTSSGYPIVRMNSGCNSGSYQIWNWIRNGDGTYELQDGHWGFCLDSGQVDGTLFPCSDNEYQRWQVTRVASVGGYDYYTLRNVYANNWCLDAGQSKVPGHNMMFGCNQGYWQMFARY